LAKSLVKGGVALYEMGREAVAGRRKDGGVIAEMHSEMIEAHIATMRISDDQGMAFQPGQQARGENGSDRNRVVSFVGFLGQHVTEC
jgi:hypothetical protein